MRALVDIFGAWYDPDDVLMVVSGTKIDFKTREETDRVSVFFRGSKAEVWYYSNSVEEVAAEINKYRAPRLVELVEQP